MSTALDEILALAGVDPNQRKRQKRVAEGRTVVSKIRKKLHEGYQVDPRVAKYIKEMEVQIAALGDQLESLYAQANAAASLDPWTAGLLQERVGVLRAALDGVYSALDSAKARFAPQYPVLATRGV
jgi:hypothetical protein